MYVARPLREAYKEGQAEGRAEGEDRIVRMNEYLIAQKRYEDLERASTDKEYREAILTEMESAQ